MMQTWSVPKSIVFIRGEIILGIWRPSVDRVDEWHQIPYPKQVYQS